MNSILLRVTYIFGQHVWVAPLKDTKGIAITKAFRKILGQPGRNQTKYGQIKVVDFTIDQVSHGYKTMIQEFIQQRMKENLLFLKGLLEHQKLKFTGIWLQYTKICILPNYMI